MTPSGATWPSSPSVSLVTGASRGLRAVLTTFLTLLYTLYPPQTSPAGLSGGRRPRLPLARVR